MTTNEKILLVQLILEDIKNNWSSGWFGHDVEERAAKAKSLCEEIAKELGDNQYLRLAKSCTNYINIGRQEYDWNGSFFEQPFPKGFENMDELHKLPHTYKDKSEEFQLVAEEYLIYPEDSFKDWG